MVKLPRRDCMKEGQSQAHAGDGHREMSIAREEKGDGGEVELVVGLGGMWLGQANDSFGKGTSVVGDEVWGIQ